VGDISQPLTNGTEGSLRVLIIDRHPLVLAALSRLLSGPPLNAVVTATTRSTDAIDIAGETPVDLVFCDVKAEPIQGQELATLMANRCPGVKVILLAERDDEPLLVASLSCGAAGFFTKDSAVDEFLNGVSAVVHGHYVVGRNLLEQTLHQLAGTGGPASRAHIAQLSPAERGILTLLGQAQTVRSIADSRRISEKTVRNHMAKIYRKLQLRNRTEAVLCAARLGLSSWQQTS
jgi:DNA-binding NarL/FixJ family response regulator